MATERIQVKPGANFDATNLAHVDAVLQRIAKSTSHGTGWKLQSHNPDDGSITLIRQSVITQVSQSTRDRDSYDVGLSAGTKLADGAQVAAQLESDPRHQGYIMTVFEPYLGTATLAKMTPEAIRCRGAVATALSVKSWDVRVTGRPDGGFSLRLPRTYVPSRHDDKLQEVAEAVVGRAGWYVTTDAQQLTAEIIPAEPPTFPPMIRYPIKQLSKPDIMVTPFGRKLADPGAQEGAEAHIDWKAQSFALIGGMPGGGKSVTINALIAGQLAAGAELVVCDDYDKSTDFLWMKDFVRPGGWGCASLAATATALSLVFEEGQRRSEFMKARGIPNWLDLPEKDRFKPILVVVDEVSALLVAARPPAGIPKTHPLYIKAAEKALMSALIADKITDIISQQRFVGMRMILSTQITNNNTGVGPTIRGKIGHKILQGANPSKTQRSQLFSDEASVPTVPGNIRATAGVTQGVGAAELEGQVPFIYKSYFATTDDYRAHLESLGVPTTGSPEPTAAQIERHAPSLQEDEDEPPSRMRDEYGGFGKDEKRETRSDGLTGAAAAAHDLATAARRTSESASG